MAEQKNTWIVILIILILAAIAGGIYWWQTSKEDMESLDLTKVEVTDPDTSYEPNKELTEALELAENELSMSLFRGDAELAPTYDEFITAVNKAQDDLEVALGLYDEKDPEGDLDDIIKNLESVNDKLSMSLLRGDAELAPTYEEFYKNISNINQEFSTYMEEYRKL